VFFTENPLTQHAKYDTAGTSDERFMQPCQPLKVILIKNRHVCEFTYPNSTCGVIDIENCRIGHKSENMKQNSKNICWQSYETFFQRCFLFNKSFAKSRTFSTAK
jgi:hypothetical protein